jgi:hypothetical protein
MIFDVKLPRMHCHAMRFPISPAALPITDEHGAETNFLCPYRDPASIQWEVPVSCSVYRYMFSVVRDQTQDGLGEDPFLSSV